MATYKITWKPLSSLSTPLQSDTIFGHLCWAVNYLWGEIKLLELISCLKTDSCLVLSSAFPCGKLPKPVIPLRNELLKHLRDSLKQDESKNSLSDLDIASILKKVKKELWIDLDLFLGSNSVYDVQAELLQAARGQADKLLERTSDSIPQTKETIEFHNKIDRISGTTDGSGELFASPTRFYRDGFGSWLKTDFFSLEQLKEVFQFIQTCGFGKDKNTGKGRFEIKIEPYSWQACPQNNAYLNLSNMVPAQIDSILAAYNSKTKFAKLGGDYATTETPYKYPIYIIEPGAVFFAGERNTAPIGTLLSGVHPKAEIVQNLYSYSIPIMIKGS